MNFNGKKPDFSGWATKYNIGCADGRTIMTDAFADDDGRDVPIVYGHNHKDIDSVLGHGLLEGRPEGIYMYGFLNETDRGKNAKMQIEHGDIKYLSIYANNLEEHAGDVYHGVIREVSLVLAGANKGAVIDHPVIAHGDGTEQIDGEAIIMTIDDDELVISHADEEDEKKEPEKKEPEEKKEDDPVEKNQNRTVKDVLDSMNEEQRNVLEFLVAKAYEDAGESTDNNEGNDEDMKHDLFEQDNGRPVITHAMMQDLINTAKENRTSLKKVVEDSLKNGVLAHAVYNHKEDGTQGAEQKYGIADINWLFPEYHELNNEPELIKRRTEWVSTVMNGVGHSPFSRIKTSYADITMDEARAKGYVKGNRKVEEVFNLLRRTTDPQTIYKKQKLDRDDIIDITDFNVVAFIKKEMRIMLDEELARAILIGDGRSALNNDKIQENHIRPIASDDDLYTLKVHAKTGTDDDGTAKNIIRAVIVGQEEYEGSGSKLMFMPQRYLTNMLLLEDGFGRPLYTKESLAQKMMVNSIVPVPVMNGIVNDDDEVLVGVIVDLNDYKVGADRGGAMQMFEDFDIDLNQEKYLMETRCSGCLVKVHSALAVWLDPATGATYTEASPVDGDNPKAKGWYEKVGDAYVKTTDTTVDASKTYYVKG